MCSKCLWICLSNEDMWKTVSQKLLEFVGGSVFLFRRVLSLITGFELCFYLHQYTVLCFISHLSHFDTIWIKSIINKMKIISVESN